MAVGAGASDILLRPRAGRIAGVDCKGWVRAIFIAADTPPLNPDQLGTVEESAWPRGTPQSMRAVTEEEA